MASVIEWLQGKKTYIVAVAAALFNFGIVVGWWTFDNEVWAGLNALFVSLFGIALRAGVTKSGPN